MEASDGMPRDCLAWLCPALASARADLCGYVLAYLHRHRHSPPMDGKPYTEDNHIALSRGWNRRYGAEDMPGKIPPSAGAGNPKACSTAHYFKAGAAPALSDRERTNSSFPTAGTASMLNLAVVDVLQRGFDIQWRGTAEWVIMLALSDQKSPGAGLTRTVYGRY